MTLGLYVAGDTVLHRLRPAVKLAGMAIAGVGVFLIDDPIVLAAAAAGVLGLLALARVPPADCLRQIRPLALLLALIFVVHGLFTSWILGLVVVLRFAVLLLAALVVTITTRVSDMIETLERGLAPFAVLGVNPAKVSLALSLALRFIPLLADQTREVRDAQRARGLDRSLVALTTPLLIKTLRLSTSLTEALEARGWDPESRTEPRETGRGRDERRQVGKPDETAGGGL
jgi:biotin transport system permease protein